MERTTTITVTTINKVITENVKGLPARAMGGPVSARNAYLVGEQGPEIFVPNNAGNIIPNDQLGSMSGRMAMNGNQGAGSNAKTYNIVVNTGVGDPRRIGEEVVNVISKFESANGAVFARVN